MSGKVRECKASAKTYLPQTRFFAREKQVVGRKSARPLLDLLRPSNNEHPFK